MADDNKNPKEASNIFHSIMKASVKPKVKEKPKPEDGHGAGNGKKNKKQ